MASDLPSVLQCARLYLAPTKQAFWSWSEDGTAIEWRAEQTGSTGTIVLLAEIQQFVAHCVAAGAGLPPMHAIVFLFALLRRREAAERLAGGALPPTEPLWTEVKQQASLRAFLIEAVLADATRNKPEFAAQVAKAMPHRLPPELFVARDYTTVDLATIVAWLRTGLSGLTAARVQLLASTGLDTLPSAEDLELPVGEQTERLLQRLHDDPEFAGLIGLVRQLMAAVRVPRLGAAREQHAMGGVAGLGNHGSLDRLALSELAQDDDVLAMRLALNEALYVQREVPPAKAHCQRRVLLDAGVRMWGMPRVHAVAVAMALGATADRQTSVDIYCARGEAIEPVMLTTREGLTRQLEVLRLELDARAALPEFFAAAPLGDGRDEVVVVAHRDSVADPEFRRSCAAHGRAACFVAEVDERGHFRLWSVGRRGWEVVGAASVTAEVAVPRHLSQLPVYYAQRVEPLLGSKSREGVLQNLTGIAITATGLVVVTRRGHAFAPRGSRSNHSFRLVNEKPVCSHFAAGPANPPKRNLRVAPLGPWQVFYDPRGLLHFVPRHGQHEELSLELAHNRRLRAWCGSQGLLEFDQLRMRLQQIEASGR